MSTEPSDDLDMYLAEQMADPVFAEAYRKAEFDAGVRAAKEGIAKALLSLGCGPVSVETARNWQPDSAAKLPSELPADLEVPVELPSEPAVDLAAWARQIRSTLAPGTERYYRMTPDAVLADAKTLIEEWDYAADPHGYCHTRSLWLGLIEQLAQCRMRSIYDRLP